MIHQQNIHKLHVWGQAMPGASMNHTMAPYDDSVIIFNSSMSGRSPIADKERKLITETLLHISGPQASDYG